MPSLAALPPEQRAALVLVLRRGRSLGELAELLDLPEAEVRARAHAALVALVPPAGIDGQERARVADAVLGGADAGELSPPAARWRAELEAATAELRGEGASPAPAGAPGGGRGRGTGRRARRGGGEPERLGGSPRAGEGAELGGEDQRPSRRAPAPPRGGGPGRAAGGGPAGGVPVPAAGPAGTAPLHGGASGGGPTGSAPSSGGGPAASAPSSGGGPAWTAPLPGGGPAGTAPLPGGGPAGTAPPAGDADAARSGATPEAARVVVGGSRLAGGSVAPGAPRGRIAVLVGGVLAVLVAALAFLLLEGDGRERAAARVAPARATPTPTATPPALEPAGEVAMRATRTRARARGVMALFRTADGRLAFTIRAERLPESRRGETYALWFLPERGAPRHLGFTDPVGEDGRLVVGGPRARDARRFPRLLAAAEQVVLARARSERSRRPDRVLLRGRIPAAVREVGA